MMLLAADQLHSCFSPMLESCTDAGDFGLQRVLTELYAFSNWMMSRAKASSMAPLNFVKKILQSSHLQDSD
jgi:hypothetical protein